jgi:hypothetical protein
MSTKKILLIIFAVVVLTIVIYTVYTICMSQGLSTGDITFDPVTGAVVVDTLGNGDGQINPGERVDVFLRLKNTGNQDISGFELVLSEHDNEVEFIGNQNRLQFDAIPVGETVQSQNSFAFKTDSTFNSNCVVFTGIIENVTHAGFISDALADPENDGNTITFALDAYNTNYRLCFGYAEVQRSTGTGISDSLVLNVSMCNRTSDVLPNVSVLIESLGVCGSPSTTFNPISKELDYGNVSPEDTDPNRCQGPLDASARFAFAPLSVPAGGFMCVYFVITIKSNNVTVIELNEGIEAIVDSLPQVP